MKSAREDVRTAVRLFNGTQEETLAGRKLQVSEANGTITLNVVDKYDNEKFIIGAKTWSEMYRKMTEVVRFYLAVNGLDSLGGW